MPAESNDSMVNRLVEKGYIESERVESAFRAVDRGEFVPESKRGDAYRDRPLRVAEGATISAPHMVAINTELLEVEGSPDVLEVGSGTGYQLAILSELTEGEVVGIEILEELARRSRERLEERGNVTVLHGDGLNALADADLPGVYDRVLFSCAVESMEDLERPLAEDGIGVAPVQRSTGQVLVKTEGGDRTTHGGVRFVPKR